VFTSVSTNVDVFVKVETGVTEELVVGGGFGVRTGAGGGLFITCHFTRSRVATESSKDEWPTLAPPV